MLLDIQNIAKVFSASIEINGITVIAGENNTGKSTIAKALYCLFNSFYNSQEKIQSERISDISMEIRRYLMTTRRYTKPSSIKFPVNFKPDILISDIMQEINIDQESSEEIANKIISSLSKEFENENKQNFEDDDFSKLTKRIIEKLNIKDKAVQTIILDRYFTSEFSSQINHVNNIEAPSVVSLKIQNEEITVKFVNNVCYSYKNGINLMNEAIYIDSPFVMDNLYSYGYSRFGYIAHRENLQNKLMSKKSHALEDVFDEAINTQKLATVIKKISYIANGEFINNSNTEEFKESYLLKPLHLSNLSTGLKSFVILKKLIENGEMLENGILILDEPEIHLHPAWQLAFAEILVLLQKELNLNIVLNTHSPYFLHAIEVYSEKHGIENKCKYYLAELVENLAVIRDVTFKTELIYKKLAAPLQQLEDIKFGMDGNDL